MRRATTVTVLASFALQGTVLVSGVLAARILGVEGRGFLALLMLFPLGISLLLGLGVPLSVTYYVSRSPGIAPRLARSLTSLVAAQAALILVLHLIVIGVVFWDESASVRVAALLTLAAGPGMLVQQYGLSFIQAQDRFNAFNVLRLLPFALYSVGTVAILVSGSDDLVPVAVVWAWTYLVAGAVTLGYALRHLPEPSDDALPTRSTLLRFGAKGVIGWASPVEAFRLDQIVAGLFLSPVALGLYVAGLAFTNLPRFVAQAIGMVAYPKVSARAGAEARRTMWRFFWVNLAGTLLIAGALALALPPLLPLFFGQDFAAAVPIGRILLLAAVFASLRRVLTDAVRGIGRPGIGTAAEVASWVLLLPALVVFAPLWKIEGVAAALVLSSAASFFILLGAVLRTDRRPTSTVAGLQGT